MTVIAQRLSHSCILGILDYLWEDAILCRFHQRQARRCKDYDQTLAHQILYSRNIAPIHVCRSWRAQTIHRYYRHALINLAHPTKSMPLHARQYVERLFVVIGRCPNYQGTQSNATPKHTYPLLEFPRAHTLALCFLDSCAWISARDSSMLTDNLLRGLPALKTLWFQNLGELTLQDYSMMHALQHEHLNFPKISAAHLSFSAYQDDSVALNIIKESSDELHTLCVTRISGDTLSQLFNQQKRNNGERVVYSKLTKLVFSVDVNAHIYATPQITHPFPNLQHLHFDDSQLRGAPREEWHGPLFDMLVKRSGLYLTNLTFPIVYNTNRTINAQTCPVLENLWHIKCCWATDIRSQNRHDSDSTRVLKSIGTITTLKRYTHPSRISRLSGIPEMTDCSELEYLNLFGWPLTLSNVKWILGAFKHLRILKVTITKDTSMEDQDDEDVDDVDDSGIEDIGLAMVQRVEIRAADSGAVDIGVLNKLVGLVSKLPEKCQVLLFGAAYAHLIQTIEQGKSKHHSILCQRLGNIRNQSIEMAGDSQLGSTTTWWHTAGTAATTNLISTRHNNNSNNQIHSSWHLVQQLLTNE